MEYCGETFRLYYIAKGFVTGLTDVRMVVYKPNGTKQGVYTLAEVNQGDGKGIYYYDYVDSDIEGSYLFVVNCPTNPKKDAKQVSFYDRASIGWSLDEKKQIRSALGVTGDKVDASNGQLQTIADEISFIKDVEGGKWEIVNNQMIFYDATNINEIMRFDLYNSSGIPSSTNVAKRERV